MRVLLVVFLLAFVAFAAASSEWVITPSGWRPASCVHGPIPTDHTIVDLMTHSYQRNSAGQLVKRYEPCAYPPSSTKPLPNGWAAYAWSNYQGSSFTSYNGSWSVPPTPADPATQTLFLFTGFQNAFTVPKNITNIIQPVLQWGTSAAGGGKYWALASWYVDSAGNVYYSAVTQTASGHNIQGNMMVSGTPPSGTWTIQAIDTSSGQQTTLNVKTNTTEPFAFVTLEVYGILTCGDYPTGSDVFSNLVFQPSFTPNWAPVATPGCEESVSVLSPSSVQINF